MKRYFKGGLIFLFALFILLGGMSVRTVIKSQSYGRLINYVGIVRGTTQRFVKLELAGRPDDRKAIYVDGILRELSGQEGPYELPFPGDKDYRHNLSSLCSMWEELKGEIKEYRSGRINVDSLLALSEDLFDQANETVFSAERYAAGQTRKLLLICIALLSTMLLVWMMLLLSRTKRMATLENANVQLNDLARRDPLTGVYLLNAFKEEAQRTLDGANEKYALVYTDFNDFKYINDVFGYAYGDSLLSKYGELLLSGLREGEICGRVIADNFVLLLRYDEKKEVADRQRLADGQITEFMRSSHSNQALLTCCGICCVEDVIEDLKIEGYLDRANFARKTVKNGVNQNYVFYNDSIRRKLWEEKNVEGRMHDAIEKREFVVYYQPKVDLKTGKACRAEALVRWRTSDGEIIPPDRFIPVFERNFMIHKLDQYVFEEVCRWLRRLLDQRKPTLPVSVNVSRLQFYDPGFVSRYVEIRDKYRIPDGLLEIEFTESIVIDNTSLLLQIVEKLRQERFACSIDDFGKGYSSLSVLKDLPVDTIKIDRFFFTESSDRQRDLDLIKSIIELVHKFHISVVAEGIERQDQVDYLTRFGCDLVQGYFFYRPMSQTDYEALLLSLFR